MCCIIINSNKFKGHKFRAYLNKKEENVKPTDEDNVKVADKFMLEDFIQIED